MKGEDHVLLIGVGPADKIELAMESISKTFSKIAREATVVWVCWRSRPVCVGMQSAPAALLRAALQR